MAQELLLPPKQEQQPTFPQTNVNVSQNGMSIQILLAPGIALSTMLGEETMNEVCKMWVQTRKNIADQLRAIEHVQSSKIN